MSFEIFSVMMDDDLNNDSEHIPGKEEDEDNLEQLSSVEVSFTCEDCDYRWDISVPSNEGDEIEEEAFYCPMCGSTSVTQI